MAYLHIIQYFIHNTNTRHNGDTKLPKLKVAGPNPVSRSNNNKDLADLVKSFCIYSGNPVSSFISSESF